MIKNWLGSKVGGFGKDEGAAKLFKTDGSYKETNCKDRYLSGFTDIISRHMSSLKNDKIIFLFSHSDGIGAFLKSVGSKEKIEDPDYCATVAVKLDLEGEKWKTDQLRIFRK